MNSDDDTRKRGHQDDIDASISSKRAAIGAQQAQQLNNYYHGHNHGHSGGSPSGMDPEGLYFKLLCPQTITGLIIGRGGSIINHLNSTCGAKIKLSQNNEFFPGSTDRILILNGSKEGIANAIRELVTRIADAPDKKPSSGSPAVDMYGNPLPPVNRAPNGAFQIKVLIPRTASAAVIGKGGSVIRHMAEISNCKFQMGDESDPYNTKERIVIITASSVQNLVAGSQTIMGTLLDEPRIRNYVHLTTNYAPVAPSPVQGRVASGPPQGMGPSSPNPQMMGGMSPPPIMSAPNPYGMPLPIAIPSPYMQGPYGAMMSTGMALPPMQQQHMAPPGSMPMPQQFMMHPQYMVGPMAGMPGMPGMPVGMPGGMPGQMQGLPGQLGPMSGGMSGGPGGQLRGPAPNMAYNPYGYAPHQP